MYKGLYPSTIKAVLSSGMTFLFYEQTCQVLVSMRSNNQQTVTR